ncbi:MAG: hypothetical protein PHZ07_02010 [Patescibacteria group bacterium]|nr:hypothetical protein [Patescibacteria group bacterium]MDD4304040.1 hypothetical protein [Patescibacteria group bacterium]MDD4694917.1 hypothetical protein [Patescibacteria group bacterium]
MLENLKYLVFVGVIVQLIGVSFYINNTLKGTTKPNRVTWLLWSIAPLIATFAAFSDGVRLSVVPVFMSGFAPLLVFLASFVNKNSYWKLEKFDYVCGFFSVVALLLWWITKNPVVAIIFAIISDFFAAIPTLIKSWKYPETETVNIFICAIFNALTSFVAISIWNFVALAFPIYLLIFNIFISILILRKKIFKRF